MKINLKEILFNNFGLKEFRNEQIEPIKNILNLNDTLVIMPTGKGKSLIFQFPAIYFNGMTIVISPLISLMKDQVENLKKKNINAEFYNSSLNIEERKIIMNKILNNELKFLYIAPERIFMENFIDQIKNVNISLIVIDEIHCVTWENFRPEYGQLKEIKNIFQNVPLVGLTATAEPLILERLKETFKFQENSIFIHSPIRKNLIFNVEKKVNNGYDQIIYLMNKNKNKPTIIYCYSKDEVKKLNIWLKKHNIKSSMYHSDIKEDTKQKTYKDFIENKIQVVVATIAFGMGIDKPDIGCVIHKEPSYNIENYIQETGRAGRNSDDSNIYLLYSKRDLVIFNFIMNNSSLQEKNKFYLMKMFMESNICYNKIIERYFMGNFKTKDCLKCSNCIRKKEHFKNINFVKYLNEIFKFNERKYTPKMLIDKIISNKNISLSEKTIENMLFQLYIYNYIDYDINNYNYVINKKEIEENFIFIKPEEPETNFKLSENRIFVTKSISKTVKKTVTKPVTKSTSKTAKKTVTKPVTKSTSKTVKKTVTKPVTKSTSKTVKKTVTKPVTKSTSKTAKKTINKPVTKSTSKTAKKTINK